MYMQTEKSGQGMKFSWNQTSAEEESDIDFKDLYTLYRNFF